MEDLITQSLAATEKYFDNVSDTELNKLLSDLNVNDYEGDTIDEYFTKHYFDESENVLFNHIDIQGCLSKDSVNKILRKKARKYFSKAAIDEHLHRYYLIDTEETKTKSKEDKKRPLFLFTFVSILN